MGQYLLSQKLIYWLINESLYVECVKQKKFGLKTQKVCHFPHHIHRYVVDTLSKHHSDIGHLRKNNLPIVYYLLFYIRLRLYGSYLLNKSLSSCSEENWPRLATNRVEQGELLVWADIPGLWHDVWTCRDPAAAAAAAAELTVVLRGLVRMGVAAMGGWGRAADTAWGEATMVGWWIC